MNYQYLTLFLLTIIIVLTIIILLLIFINLILNKAILHKQWTAVYIFIQTLKWLYKRLNTIKTTFNGIKALTQKLSLRKIIMFKVDKN